MAVKIQEMAEAINDCVVDDIYGHNAAQFEAQAGLAGHRPASFDVLALSGGTELGAWGAGFMAGWKAAGAAAAIPRPTFQMVTGVSAGALMATHTFLGLDAEMDLAFKTTGDDDLFRKRYWLEWLWADALVDDRKKDETQRLFLTAGLVDEVAAQRHAGRRLFVGVLDMAQGRFKQIDMVKLASTPDPACRYASYRAVIGGATAVPVVMPHKKLGKLLLADGAVHQPLAVPPPGAVSLPGSVDRRLFVIAQQPASVPAGSYPELDTLKILGAANRTIACASAALMESSLRLVHQIANKPHPGDGKALFETRYAGVPGAMASCAGALGKCRSGETFCKRYMECLSKQGQAQAQTYASGAQPWPVSPWHVPGLMTCEQDP